MVVHRNEVKKKRREGDSLDDSVDGCPKRTKVHAQRKFAQGSSSISSVALTPVKDRDKLKTNGTIVSSELMPLKRPKTEDFLTFLCFRGSTILPPSLNIFNVATFQDSQDEESCVPVRDRSPNPLIDLTSVGQKLQQVLKIGQVAEDYKIDETKRNDVTKQRASAVQAIRRKYQGQRLAKQRATTLHKVTHKVHAKSMVMTRSSSMREESNVGIGIYESKNPVIVKCMEKDDKTPKPMDFNPLRRRSSTFRRHKLQDLEYPSKRRCGLRSSPLLPLRTRKSVDSRHTSTKLSKQSSEFRSFMSSLSDFSSDDDQPLMKSAPVTPVNKKDIPGKVTKRIVNEIGEIQTQILTRSRVQQQIELQDVHPRLQQKWSSREVGCRQQLEDKNAHSRMHYLYRHRRLLETGRMKQPLHVHLKRVHPVSAQDQRVSPQVTTRFSSRSSHRNKETSTMYFELLRNKSSNESDLVKSCSTGNLKKILTTKKKETQTSDTKLLGRKDQETQGNIPVKTHKYVCDKKLGVQKNPLSSRQKLFLFENKKEVQTRKNIQKHKREPSSLNCAGNDLTKKVTCGLRKRSYDSSINVKGNLRRTDVRHGAGGNSTHRDDAKDKERKHNGNINTPYLIGKRSKCEKKALVGVSKGLSASESESCVQTTPKRVSQRKKISSEALCCEKKKKSESVEGASIAVPRPIENCELRRKSKNASRLITVPSKMKSAHQKSLRRSLRNVLQTSCTLSESLVSNLHLQKSIKHVTLPNSPWNPQKVVSNSSESKFNDSDEEPLKKIALKNTSKHCRDIQKPKKKTNKLCNSLHDTETQACNKTEKDVSKLKDKLKTNNNGSSNMSSLKNISSKCDQRNVPKRKGINYTKISKTVDVSCSKRITIGEKIHSQKKKTKTIKHNLKVRSTLDNISREISEDEEALENKLLMSSTKYTEVSVNFSKPSVQKGKSVKKRVISKKVTNPSIVTELFPSSSHLRFGDSPKVSGSINTISGKNKTRIKCCDKSSKANEEVLRNLLKQFSDNDINDYSKNNTSDHFKDADGEASIKTIFPQYTTSHQKKVVYFKEILFEKNAKKSRGNFSGNGLGDECENLTYENYPVSESDLQNILHMAVLKEDMCQNYVEEDEAEEKITLNKKKCAVKQKKMKLEKTEEISSENHEKTLSPDVAHSNLEESSSSYRNRAKVVSKGCSAGKMPLPSPHDDKSIVKENGPVAIVEMAGNSTVNIDTQHATGSLVKLNLAFDPPENMQSIDDVKFEKGPRNKCSLLGIECNTNRRAVEKESVFEKRDTDFVDREKIDDVECKKLICFEKVNVNDDLRIPELQKNFVNNDQDINCFSSASNEKSEQYILKYFSSDFVTKNPSAAKMSANINGEKPFLGSDVSSSEFPDPQPVRSKQLIHAEMKNDSINIDVPDNNLNNMLDDVEKDCITHNAILPSDLGLQDLKVKEKLNMSAERVEKWLSENCSSNVVHKKDCTLFEKNICCCGFSVSDDDLCSPYGIDKFSLCDDSGECDEESGIKSQFGFGFTNDDEVNRRGNSALDRNSKQSTHHAVEDNFISEKGISSVTETSEACKEHTTNEEKGDLHAAFDLGDSSYINSSLTGKRNLYSEIIPSQRAHEIATVSSSQACAVNVAECNISISDPSPIKIPVVHAGNESKIQVPQESKIEEKSNSNKYHRVCGRHNDVQLFHMKTKNISKPNCLPSTAGRTKGTLEGFSEKKSIFRNRRFPLKTEKQKDLIPSANAFSPDNESSVYAFEAESEVSPSTPFRRHTRDSRTSSSTTKSEEDITKLVDDETSCADYNSPLGTCTYQRKQCNVLVSSPLHSDIKEPDAIKLCTRAFTSIAVQVNLDSGTYSDSSSHCVISTNDVLPESFAQRTIECSTQTEGMEEEEDTSEENLMDIPLEHAETPAQQFIQGVTVKVGPESKIDSNQRDALRGQLVSEPAFFGSRKSDQEETLKIRSFIGTKDRCFGAALQNSIVPASSINVLNESMKSTLNSVSSADNANDEFANSSSLGVRDNECSVPDIMQKCQILRKCSEPVASNLKPALMKLKAKNIQNSDSSCSSTAVQNSNCIKHVEDAKFPCDKDSQPYKMDIGFPKRSLPRGKFYKPSDNKYSFFPTNVSIFPSTNSPGQLVEAPVFYPTDKEFQDPLEYIDKIKPLAETFGLCRIVPPPNFKPECKVSDDMRFTAYNQYVHKMLQRWGPNAKEMMAIRKYLNTQNIPFIHPPLIGGMEVDLPRLYKTVQTFGGLKRVIEKKRWHKVADSMKIPKSAQDRLAKLDDIYCKYLLPYDTLSSDERRRLLDSVEEEWQQRQKKPLTQDGSASSDNQDDEIDIADEECIVKGRSMPLNAFYRIARNTMAMWFRLPEPSSSEVEQEFWNHVMSRACHVCVHSGSIDSSGCGYGFPCSKNSPFARHPWNLKVLTNNSGSVLRSIGPIMGITVPTLHVGMLFSTCCWYRDPHGLPWIEYLHTGAKKIWYGIPDSFSYLFRSAMNDMIPRYCKSKTIWLPSDTAMVPPSLLVKHGVSLCHTVQEPGQFIVVFPRAFTSSICTGYLVSESVYFAQPRWLLRAEEVFKDIRDSCEPSVFSLERLLISIAEDPRSHVDVLKQVLPMIISIRDRELDQRKVLYNLGLKTSERLPLPEANMKRRKIRQAQEEEGDYECEICRANLFISLIINSHEEGVYCLEHAIDLITKKRHHLKYCKLMYTYDQVELRGLITKLQEKIDFKSQRKSSHGKHGMSSAK